MIDAGVIASVLLEGSALAPVALGNSILASLLPVVGGGAALAATLNAAVTDSNISASTLQAATSSWELIFAEANDTSAAAGD